MLITMWQIWVIAALLLFIVEIFTTGFAVVCLSVGCIGGAMLAACGVGILWQVAAFALFSALAFVFVRPLLLKWFYKNKQGAADTNADAMIGQRARVGHPVSDCAGNGTVFIYGEEWSAVSEDGTTISTNETVEITARNGLTLTVRRKA